MICETLLSAGYNPSCQAPQRGFEADGIIINRSDIDFATSTLNATNGKGSVVLKSGKTGYPVKQTPRNAFDGSSMELNVGTYINTWTKNINVLLMSVGPDTTDIVNKLVNGDTVLILRNRTKEDAAWPVDGQGVNPKESEYEVFGWEQGLKASAGTRTPNDEDTMGGTQLTLTETGASSHGLFMFVTDKAATDTAYQSLLNAN